MYNLCNYFSPLRAIKVYGPINITDSLLNYLSNLYVYIYIEREIYIVIWNTRLLQNFNTSFELILIFYQLLYSLLSKTKELGYKMCFLF